MANKRKGGVAELVVCADLLRKGHDVFRSANAHTTCDLVAIKDGLITRIEVRTVQRRVDGSIVPSIRVEDECDLYAFVSDDGVIEYMLPAEAWSLRRIRSNSVRPENTPQEAV